ncbi:hypothetical protein [Paenibacillus koleovorans]|uniref:hypothetical protein n=1 Tax=Paenibacillus koleovorans TaxID=121608 RepID=UPI0013E3B6F1|nr:hypothetical protein [Paenibacillus koleovorans]
MNRPHSKLLKSAAGAPADKSAKVTAPSIRGGADREYTVVFEKKATYRKPSFAR